MSVLNEDTLDSMVHTLTVQVIDGFVIHWHCFIHCILDATRVIICQGYNVHEAVPWSSTHIVVDGTGRNVKRGSPDRRINKKAAIRCVRDLSSITIDIVQTGAFFVFVFYCNTMICVLNGRKVITLILWKM